MSTFYTGDIPTEALLEEMNVFTKNGMSFIPSELLWNCCLDAPSNIPAGSTFSSDEIGFVGRSFSRKN